jgi:hypothetical protein
MQYSGNQPETTSNPLGYSMKPIQSHCMALNEKLRKTYDHSSMPTSTVLKNIMHGPGGHGHDFGDEHQ